MSNQTEQKFVISNKDRKLCLALILSLSLGTVIKGVNDIATNPQMITQAQRQEIWNAGYKQQSIANYEDRSSVAFGSIFVLLGSAAAIMGTHLFMPQKPKFDYRATMRLDNQKSSKAEQELKLKQAKQVTIKKSLKPFLVQLFTQCPYLQLIQKAPAICHWGEGGAGKSRMAMCMATLQLLNNWEPGSELWVLDTQLHKNRETWIAGTIFEEEQIPFIKQELTSVGRDKNSPHRSIVVDEAGELTKNTNLRPALIAAMNSAKADARSRKVSFHFTGHTIAQAEFGGDDPEAAAVRRGLLRAATHFYYPLTQNSDGERVKSTELFMRQGMSDYTVLPERINQSSEFRYTEGWERFAIPADLDPAVFAELLMDHIIALGIKPSNYEAVQSAKEIDENLQNAIEDIAENVEMMEELSFDENLQSATQNPMTVEFPNIQNKKFDTNLNEVLNLTELEKKFLGLNFKELKLKYIDYEGHRILSVDSLRRSKVVKDNLGGLLPSYAFVELLQGLDHRSVGVLSQSKKYWISPN